MSFRSVGMFLIAWKIRGLTGYWDFLSQFRSTFPVAARIWGCNLTTCQFLIWGNSECPQTLTLFPPDVFAPKLGAINTGLFVVSFSFDVLHDVWPISICWLIALILPLAPHTLGVPGHVWTIYVLHTHQLYQFILFSSREIQCHLFPGQFASLMPVVIPWNIALGFSTFDPCVPFFLLDCPPSATIGSGIPPAWATVLD